MEKEKKLSMCRICLVENVRMYVVTNKSLQEMYEKLTDIPFITEDSRPMLACYFCYSKLKQCWQLQGKCLKSEELLAQMLSVDYEQKPLTNQGFVGGFIISPVENINIVDECQKECDAIKQEPADVCEQQCDVELKVEHLCEELDPDISHPDVEDTPVLHSTSESIDEQDLSEQEDRLSATERAAVAKKPKLLSRKRKLEDSIPGEQPMNELSTTITHSTTSTTNTRTSEAEAKFKEFIATLTKNVVRSSHSKQLDQIHTDEKPHKCEVCQHGFSCNSALETHFRKHSGEKPFKCEVCQQGFRHKKNLKIHVRKHTGEKPFKCEICQHCFGASYLLKRHSRIHTCEKPYKCEVCQRGFGNSSDMKRHSKIHTHVKPYKCGICSRDFFRMDELKRHNITMHTDRPV